MATATDDKSEIILACIRGFLTSLSAKPPLSEDAQKYILPESFAVLSHPGPDGLIQCTLSDFLARTEANTASLYSSGATSAVYSLTDPEPVVWTGGRFSAVWTGYSLIVDGVEKSRGVYAFTLFERDDGWRIGGIASKQWPAANTEYPPPPPFSDDVTPEMVGPTLELCKLLNEEKWEEVESLMLPGSGATYMRYPGTLLMMEWPEFFSRMRAMLEKAKPGYVHQELMDWEGRICGDVGLIWTPFTVALDGEVRIRGYNVFSMLRRADGKWLISGAQDG
ncbi:hypothetical protein QBC46DRAFT_394446 [Diplogelasinospora grovesii]|uniref:SnoaL-like domain-containing protein n=1 Tax=Diplogelasinospora grovesii TaxID=303347 RepID=A0AAN6N014_9PEZI|nr:hypothetical protein QBC46DRAFT_394446 [Diplogelasinospora grovesii]